VSQPMGTITWRRSRSRGFTSISWSPRRWRRVGSTKFL